MSKIKMLQSMPGALNGGLDVKMFKKGFVYPNEDCPDLEGLDVIFLNEKVAEPYKSPEEVVRREKGLRGAPFNKREKDPEENKEVEDIDPDNGDDFFTFEELDGASAGEIRKLAEENGIDLTDFAKNTSAANLINAYLDRQGEQCP